MIENNDDSMGLKEYHIPYWSISTEKPITQSQSEYHIPYWSISTEKPITQESKGIGYYHLLSVFVFVFACLDLQH